MLLAAMIVKAQSERVVHVVSEPWPPYIIDDGNTKGGIEHQIAQEVFQLMGYSMKYDSLPWKRAIGMVKDGQADAILGIFETEERKDFLFFPDEALIDIAYFFFTAKEDAFEFKGLESLTNKRVGTILGYHYTDAFGAAENFEKHPVLHLDQNFKKLLAKRIDIVVANRHVGMYTAQKMQAIHKIRIADQALSAPQPHYIAFARKPNAQALSLAFSQTLRGFKQTSRYHEIIQNYGQ